jgi:hypothetical protein
MRYPKHGYPTAKRTNCIYPTCDYQHHARGYCLSHYVKVKRYIDRGLTTWRELVKKGKALPPQPKAERAQITKEKRNLDEFGKWILGN